MEREPSLLYLLEVRNCVRGVGGEGDKGTLR